MDYLYRQTGRAMQNTEPDTEETDQMLEDIDTEEEFEDEGFEDADVDPTVGLFDITDPSSKPSTVITSSACVVSTLTSLQPPSDTTTAASGLLATKPMPAQPQQQLVSISNVLR